MSDSFSARRQLFQSALFQDQVADRLELDRGLVYPAINAMLQADMIPCRLSRNHKALATDGAMILAAIGGRQSLAASIVRVGCAVCAMNMQHEIGAPQRGSGADMFPTSASFSFGTDVAEVLLNLWRISRGSSTKGFKGVTIGIYWSDVLGSTLFGAIEQPSLGRKRTYATQALPAPPGGGDWEFIQMSAVGGTLYSPMSILRFGALLDTSVEETAAAI
ncbi:MAG: hypothetical protein QHD01_02855 [Bradyrhizobium sp.]|uniref:hypothetical protein n=1 Tax=Bradyrhizobium sp. TaxID=376 RepID=UPI0029A31C94|nr:hypothetical protein [Bradyrhizobium sp.]MDX3965524.1 hypothetical protein [Bradyrhizobium sp.]